jgi:formylglycine-generating enzyme required for sulfatase activity
LLGIIAGHEKLMAQHDKANPTDLYPAEVWERDEVSDRFHAAWIAAGPTGSPPQIEEFLGDRPEPLRSALLRELLSLDLEYRLERHEKPSPTDYLGRFPQHAATINSFFPAKQQAVEPGPSAEVREQSLTSLREFVARKERKQSAWHACIHYGVRGVFFVLAFAAVTAAGVIVRGRLAGKDAANRNVRPTEKVVQGDVGKPSGTVADVRQQPIRATAPSAAKKPTAPEAPATNSTNRATPPGKPATTKAASKAPASQPAPRVESSSTEQQLQLLLSAAPTELPGVWSALSGHREAISRRLWDVVTDPRADADARFRAAAALAGGEERADDATRRRWATVAKPMVNQLLAAVQHDPGQYARLTQTLRPARDYLLAPLAEVLHDGGRSEVVRFFATAIFAEYAASRPEAIVEALLDADEKQFAVLFPKLEKHGDRPLALLGEAVKAAGTDERSARRQANTAAALLRLDQADAVWPLLTHTPDDRVCSRVIDGLAERGVDPRMLIRQLSNEAEVSRRRGLLLCLGQFGPDQVPAAERESFLPALLRAYHDDRDSGIHGAVEWLLRRWDRSGALADITQELAGQSPSRFEHVRRELAASHSPLWYVNGHGQTMIVLPGPAEFFMGSPQTEAGRIAATEPYQRTRIDHAFAIAAKPVTVQDFHRFRQREHDHWQQYAPTSDCPMHAVSWYAAAEYCNWLSKQEGLPESEWCYLPNDAGQFAEGMRLAPDWQRRTGYRLPTEAEWEYACRAGSVTARSYGETAELLDRYAWYQANSVDQSHPVGLLKPNAWGLFDMLGNVWNWCQNGAHDTSGDAIDSRDGRVLRGGAFSSPATLVRSAARVWNAPSSSSPYVGFRPVRTVR